MSIPTSTRTLKQLNHTLENLIKDFHLPGLSLATTLPNGEQFEFNYGKRTDSSCSNIDNNTIFAAASVTKSFTALATVSLASSGALALDDRLTKWLPNLQLPNGSENEVTIRHLLSHSSGLPGLPFIHGARTPSILRDRDSTSLVDRAPLAEDWQWIRTVDDLISALSQRRYSMLDEPGSVYNYSNEGFGLLQGIIEAASGQTYIEVLAKGVFEPLRIERYGFTADDLATIDNVAPLYAPVTGSGEPYSLSSAWWDVGRIYSNGSLKISSSALLRIVDEVTSSSALASQLLGIGPNEFRMITSSEIDLPDGSRYGLGVELAPAIDERQWFGHSGSIKGTSTHVRAYPEQGLSIVCLVNASDAPVTRITEAVVEVVLGTDHVDPPPHESTTEAYREELAGLYVSGELNEVLVIAEEGSLYVQRNDGVKSHLIQTDLDSFVALDGRRYIFLRSSGEITSLFSSKRVLSKLY